MDRIASEVIVCYRVFAFKTEGAGEYSTIKALGQEVASCSTVYFWPKENRQVGDNKKVGILYVECDVSRMKSGELGGKTWLKTRNPNRRQNARCPR